MLLIKGRRQLCEQYSDRKGEYDWEEVNLSSNYRLFFR